MLRYWLHSKTPPGRGFFSQYAGSPGSVLGVSGTVRDELPGLPNRRHAVRYLNRHLAAAQNAGSRVWVLFLDLDGFKAVNDTSGHHAGDEFFLACPRLDEAGAAALARRLRRVMALPFQVGATEVVIGASVGIAASQPDSTVDSLLRSADTQMYLDKSRPVATVLPD